MSLAKKRAASDGNDDVGPHKRRRNADTSNDMPVDGPAAATAATMVMQAMVVLRLQWQKGRFVYLMGTICTM
jgi:hypothetical protein